MATLTVQQLLNRANITDFAAYAKGINLGDIIAGLKGNVRALTGLTSSATHVHDVAGKISTVELVEGTPLAIVTGTAGVGQVAITYDVQGVATLVFGDGAQTSYIVTEQTLPAGLGTELARTP